MSNLDNVRLPLTSAPVNQVLLEHPATVAVFNAFGIDACCGGDVSIEEAARRDGADASALLTALDAIIASAAES
jgi:iron-sulfur cluster repair protein YtfE (RIC family)